KSASEIRLHAFHEVTREAAEVFELHGVFRGNNKPKLVPIFPAAGLEFLQVRSIDSRAVGLRRLAVAGDSVSNDVAQICVDCPWAGCPEHNESRFHDNSTRSRTER